MGKMSVGGGVREEEKRIAVLFRHDMFASSSGEMWATNSLATFVLTEMRGSIAFRRCE